MSLRLLEDPVHRIERAAWVLAAGELQRLGRPSSLEEFWTALRGGKPFSFIAARRAAFRLKAQLLEWGADLVVHQEHGEIAVEFPRTALDLLEPYDRQARLVVAERMANKRDRKESLRELEEERRFPPPDLVREQYRRRGLKALELRFGSNWRHLRALVDGSGVRELVLSVEQRSPRSRVVQALELFVEQGATVRDVAGFLACSTRTAWRLLRRHAVETDPRHRDGVNSAQEVLVSEKGPVAYVLDCRECAATGRVGSGPSSRCGVCRGWGKVRVPVTELAVVHLGADGKRLVPEVDGPTEAPVQEPKPKSRNAKA